MTKENKKQREIGSKTMMIKSHAYNQIKRYFHPKDDLYINTNNEQKLEAIEKIMNETRAELTNYKQKRRTKAKVQELRQKKTTDQFVSEHPELAPMQNTLNGQFPTFVMMANDLLKKQKQKA